MLSYEAQCGLTPGAPGPPGCRPCRQKHLQQLWEEGCICLASQRLVRFQGGWREGTSSLSCVEVCVAFSVYSADGMVTESPQTAGMGSNTPSLTRPLDSGCGCRQARGRGSCCLVVIIGGGKRVAEKIPWVWEAAFMARVLKGGNRSKGLCGQDWDGVEGKSRSGQQEGLESEW